MQGMYVVRLLLSMESELMAEKLAIEDGSKAVPDSVHKPWPQITEDDRQAVLRVLRPGGIRSGYGLEIAALEREWAECVGAEHCIATNRLSKRWRSLDRDLTILTGAPFFQRR